MYIFIYINLYNYIYKHRLVYWREHLQVLVSMHTCPKCACATSAIIATARRTGRRRMMSDKSNSLSSCLRMCKCR